MSIMTYRGEKNIAELTDNLFGKLTDKQREQVSKALLKANPRLADPRKLATGTILIVPQIEGVRPKSSRALENPNALLAQELARALDAFGQHFEERSGRATADAKDQTTLLKSAGMKEALAQEPELRALAGQISTSVNERTKELQARQSAVSTALQGMLKALD